MICSLLDAFEERGQDGCVGNLRGPYTRMAKSLGLVVDELVCAYVLVSQVAV